MWGLAPQSCSQSAPTRAAIASSVAPPGTHCLCHTAKQFNNTKDSALRFQRCRTRHAMPAT
jgi:hypothetical protein